MKNSLTDVAPETAPILLDVNLMIAVDPQTVRVVGGDFMLCLGHLKIVQAILAGDLSCSITGLRIDCAI